MVVVAGGTEIKVRAFHAAKVKVAAVHVSVANVAKEAVVPLVVAAYIRKKEGRGC